ncbi:hypothetical protein CICLE_v10017314mg [Citrus x clementina]|uniref:Uncharacterized protein n=1 Tax=Citrus clementina TaxID=85681 RepID=V4U0N3_CITCL|nr:hypothetical protein CICLE_v10017314mg [Citrus x clementina]
MKRRYLQSNGRLEFNEHHCTWTPPNSTELMFQRRSYSHVFRKQTPTTRTKLNRTPRHFAGYIATSDNIFVECIGSLAGNIWLQLNVVFLI